MKYILVQYITVLLFNQFEQIMSKYVMQMNMYAYMKKKRKKKKRYTLLTCDKCKIKFWHCIIKVTHMYMYYSQKVIIKPLCKVLMIHCSSNMVQISLAKFIRILKTI